MDLLRTCRFNFTKILNVYISYIKGNSGIWLWFVHTKTILDDKNTIQIYPWARFY